MAWAAFGCALTSGLCALLHAFGHGFAQLNTPLVVRVSSPHGGLAKHFVLVQRNQRTQRVGCECV